MSRDVACRCRTFCAVSLIATSAIAQTPQFTISNDTSGLNFTHHLNTNMRFSRFFGSGPAAADYDNDGDIDVFMPQAYGYADALYRNNGDGTFTEFGAAAGVASTKEGRCALWLDYDNDGLLDLVVVCDPDAPEGQASGDTDPSTAGNLLYRNLGDGTFANVTASSGGLAANPNTSPSMTLGGAAAADYNGDGFLDIYVTCWNCLNALYRNNGDGTFTEIGAAAGVSEPGYSWAPMFADIDRDGDQDLLVNMDFTPNRLFINQGNGTFVNIAPAAGFDTDFNEMGMAIADYDRDGDLDVYCSNIEKPYPSQPTLNEYSVLLRNNDTGAGVTFTDVSAAAGVQRTGWGWGCTWIDSNNDMNLDLAVTNGWQHSVAYGVDQSCFFVNAGGGSFVESGIAAGFAQTKVGRGLVALDYDLDGDLDLCESNLDDVTYLFRNDTPDAGNWIEIDLIGPADGNQFAVGAEVSVTRGATTQRRLLSAGTSFISQEPHRQHFGIGLSTTATAISVRWPGGDEETITNVRANRVAVIEKGVGLIPDMNLDRRLDGRDLGPFVQALTGNPLRPMDSIVADVNGDELLDASDVASFVALLLGAG